MNDTNNNVYDYIIIGGGTSGSVVARRLAEGNEKLSVCVLEAGPSNQDVVNSHMPRAWLTLQKTSLDWCFETVPQKGCNNRVISLPRGRLLGGSSAVNATYLTRGTKGDYDRIVQMGNSGWSWDEILPFFKAFETFHPTEWDEADVNAHGTDGPLHTTMTPSSTLFDKILESFVEFGFDYKPDMFVQGEYEGIGHVTRTVYKGLRSTSADFIHSYPNSNLTVKTDTFVDRIILEKNNNEDSKYKAVGVAGHDNANNQPFIIKARKEIILSAGSSFVASRGNDDFLFSTYNSPTILMCSGIGCAKHLAEVGIDCNVNLPGVGKNLQDHLTVSINYQLNDPSLTHDGVMDCSTDTLISAVKEWHENKSGLMTTIPGGYTALARIDKTIQDSIWEATKSIKQLENASNCDPTGQLVNQAHVELLPIPVSIRAPHSRNADNPANDIGVIELAILLLAPQARGTVRLSSNDPKSKPIIDHAYLDNDLDVAVLAEGCRLGHQILMKGRGTKDLIVGPWPKIVPHPTDINGWKEHVRKVASTCFHPGGTCKMAPDSDPMGVVDNCLRVRNVHNLRVADISSLPILNCGHTQALAYAIGEKVAHMILQDAHDSK